MSDNYLDRRPFTAAVLAERNGALIVPGLGSPTWDCAAFEDSGDYLYSWGGMGLAAATALGVALAQPERRVCVVTGDGEMMMGIGSLSVIGAQAPSNLSILVLDNEHFGETGRQPGLAGTTDLCAVAKGAGLNQTLQVSQMDQVPALIELLFHAPGPNLAVAKIKLSSDPLVLPEKDGAMIANRFRAAAIG